MQQVTHGSAGQIVPLKHKESERCVIPVGSTLVVVLDARNGSLVDIIRQGQKDIEEGRGRVIKLEDIWK